MITLAIDCMGGDHGVTVTLPACEKFLNTHADAQLLLVGNEEVLQKFSHPRARIVPASEVVDMDDAIEVALRRKKDSSMRVAIEQVKNGTANVALSAGNTGALMAIARYVLKTLEGIDRPAITTELPNAKEESTLVLDLGANVDCTALHLLEFAVMGSALHVALYPQNPNPQVGLLNIGEEVIKGNETIKKAGTLLRAAKESGDLNFYGNVEGNDIFKGTVNIVVCDGFVGNITLKTAEGMATMIGNFLKTEFSSNFINKLVALIAMPILKRFRNRIDHRRYNGAALLGLNGLVFKSHGSADVFAFETALQRAYDAAKRDLISLVKARLAHAAPLLQQARQTHEDAA